MTIAEAVVDVKNMIGPAGKGSEVGDAGLAIWIQEALDDVVSMINDYNPDFFNKTVTTSAIADQLEYDLPSDFQKVVFVEVDYGAGWKKASPMTVVNQINVPSTPSGYSEGEPFYVISGDTIRIVPAFTETGSNNIKIRYSYLPDEIDNTTEIPLPRQLQRKLKYLVAYPNVLDQNDEHVSADRMRIRAERQIISMIEDLCTRDVSEPKSVIITDGGDMYDSESYLI